jgi:hypothetical protein
VHDVAARAGFALAPNGGGRGPGLWRRRPAAQLAEGGARDDQELAHPGGDGALASTSPRAGSAPGGGRMTIAEAIIGAFAAASPAPRKQRTQ